MVDDRTRKTFLEISDVLIPAAEGMPSAGQVGIDQVLDRLLGLRPDLKDAFMRGVTACANRDPSQSAEQLNREDPEALGAIGLIASAAYYMDPEVRKLIGYPGQENRPANADETPEYVLNGMLKVVADRGPIFRPTPK